MCEYVRVSVVMFHIIARDCPFVEKGLIAFVFFASKQTGHTGTKAREGSEMKLGDNFIGLNLGKAQLQSCLRRI